MEIKIGSFNMMNFGYSSDKDFQKIAEIIIEEEFDVVALQEILSEGKGVQRMLEQEVKRELYNWDVRFGFPKESSDSDKITDMIAKDRRGEGYAFLWNKRMFKLAEFKESGKIRVFEPRIINSLQNDVQVDCSVFSRTPFYIRLQPKSGGYFELRLINIHIYFGSSSISDIAKRKIEYMLLTREIYPEIATIPYGNHRVPYTIAMGDYNLNILNSAVEAQAKNAYIDDPLYEDVLTVQEKLTTLKESDSNEYDAKYANNFDHFTYSPKYAPFTSVTYDRIDAVEKYCDGDYNYYRKKISDHLPIVMTAEI